ncbi:hypothetical protein V1520DRAFT_94807 [Lipomyces starkeyi]|uniref:Uncharacterized protein n=1 Tax=Lipomyces starkeyi NRRL Y-11557 TaxID=675824 RepID=A0A1E3QAJ5_LIPST|nr:hypothetical protein LIPSTDRAFT_227626 [Lipomyces starkeyi NRRL Y-11557]
MKKLIVRAIVAYFHGLRAGKTKYQISTTITEISFLRGPYMARVIPNWGKHFQTMETLPPGTQSGRGCKVQVPLADQDVAADCQEFFRSIPPPQRSARRLKIHIETKIYPTYMGILDRFIISEKTCHRYLSAWGFHKNSHQQDIYYDGQERDDVKEYRNSWSKQMLIWRARMRDWDQDGNVHLPALQAGEKEVVNLVASTAMVGCCCRSPILAGPTTRNIVPV